MVSLYYIKFPHIPIILFLLANDGSYSRERCEEMPQPFASIRREKKVASENNEKAPAPLWVAAGRMLMGNGYNSGNNAA